MYKKRKEKKVRRLNPKVSNLTVLFTLLQNTFQHSCFQFISASYSACAYLLLPGETLRLKTSFFFFFFPRLLCWTHLLCRTWTVILCPSLSTAGASPSARTSSSGKSPHFSPRECNFDPAPPPTTTPHPLNSHSPQRTKRPRGWNGSLVIRVGWQRGHQAATGCCCLAHPSPSGTQHNRRLAFYGFFSCSLSNYYLLFAVLAVAGGKGSCSHIQ